MPEVEGGVASLSLSAASSGRIRVWKDPEKRELLLDEINGYVSWPVLQMPHTIYVEGVLVGDTQPTAVLTLQYLLRCGWHSDTLYVTVCEQPIGDIDTGGVRNGRKYPPEHSPTEDPGENEPPCAVLPVNSDDDDQNGIPDRDDLTETADWQASEMIEARIQVLEDAPWRVVVSYEGTGRLRIWRSATKQPGSEILPEVWQTWQEADVSLSVYLEATAASSADGDMRLTLQVDEDRDGFYTPGEPYDEVCANAKEPDCDIEVDLDIDADNDGNISEADDAVEDQDPEGSGQVAWGKILVVNNDDDDWDAIVDYFDGYNWDGIAGNDDDDNDAENELVPMKLTIGGQDSLDGWYLYITYPYADPWYPWDYWDWWLRGHVRVWIPQAGPVEGRILLPPGIYSLASLGITTGQRELDLFVEGITVSVSKGDVPIWASLFGPMIPKIGSDLVRATVIDGAILIGAADPGDFSRADDWVGFERGITRSVLLLYGPAEVSDHIQVQMHSGPNPYVITQGDPGTCDVTPTNIPDGTSEWNPHGPGAQWCYFWLHGRTTSESVDDALITAKVKDTPWSLAEAPVTVLRSLMLSPTSGTGPVPLNPPIICPNLPPGYYNLFGTSYSNCTWMYGPPDTRVPRYCVPNTREPGCHLRHDVIETAWVRLSPSYHNYGVPIVEQLTRISPMPNDAGEMTNFRVDGQVPPLPGTTPEGTTWYIRFCHPSLSNDPVYPLSSPEGGWVSEAEAKQYDLVTYPLRIHVCGSPAHPAPSTQEAQALADAASWIWSQAGIAFGVIFINPETLSDDLMDVDTHVEQEDQVLAINNLPLYVDSYLVWCVRDNEGLYSGGITAYPSVNGDNKGSVSSYYWGFFDTGNLSEQDKVRYRVRALSHEIGHHIMDSGQEESDDDYLMYGQSSEYKRYISLPEALRVRNEGPLPSNPDEPR
jgi:hypothetical protein